tara:strand:+ start:857 stop:1225 length:369 start_codon:yes stop_codon:yes gene_type:complete
LNELNGKNVEYKTVENKQNANDNLNGNENHNLNNEESIVPKNETIDVTISLLDKIKEEKNIKIILLVIISYMITSSIQFNDILGNSFPYLMENGSTNLLGKLVIALIIGLSVVLFTSFFQDR